MGNHGKPTVGFHTNPERINRNGRPPEPWTWSGTIRRIAEEEVETKDGKKQVKELVGQALRNEAIKGNVPAIKEWGDRIDGKAPQGVGTTDPDGQFKPQENLVVLYGKDEPSPATDVSDEDTA